MKKWQIAISILLVFALGTAAGAYGSRVIYKNRVSKALNTAGAPGIKVIRGMMSRLALSEAQRAAIGTILEKNNEKWETIRQEYEPKIKTLYETVIEEAKQELTDEQRQEIENMSAKVQRRLSPRYTSPPRSSSPPESSAPGEGAWPPSMSQPFGPQPQMDRVDGIIDRLQLDPKKSGEVRPIIEMDLERRQAVQDEFERSRMAAEEKFQKAVADAQAATDKKLEHLLTPEQMKTYRRMMRSEELHHEKYDFNVPGNEAPPKNFSQEALPLPPDGKSNTFPER